MHSVSVCVGLVVAMASAAVADVSRETVRGVIGVQTSGTAVSVGTARAAVTVGEEFRFTDGGRAPDGSNGPPVIEETFSTSGLVRAVLDATALASVERQRFIGDDDALLTPLVERSRFAFEISDPGRSVEAIAVTTPDFVPPDLPFQRFEFQRFEFQSFAFQPMAMAP